MNNKSIFTKMFFVYMLVLFLSVATMLIAMNKYLNSYFISKNEEALLKHCENIQSEFDKINQSILPILNYKNLIYELSEMEKYTDSRVLLVDKKGGVYIDPNSTNKSSAKLKIEYEELSSVFKGNIITKQDFTYKYFDEPSLVIGYPLKNNNTDEVEFSLFVVTSLPEINKTINEIFHISILIIILSSLVMFFIIYIIGLTLKREFNKIIFSVKNIAKGNFSRRIETNRLDELGELSYHINFMAGELEDIENSRKNFISNVSHDLRSPLTSILGYSQAMIDNTIPVEKFPDYLKIIKSESERLITLSNSLIELNRIDSKELIKEDFEINNMVLNVLDSFEQRLLEKDLNIDIKLACDKCLAYANKTQMERVVHNLIDNAIKFSLEHSIINIQIESNSDRYKLSINNKGDIIPGDKLNKIWEKFYKEDSSRNNFKSGYGIGLSIVRDILINHEEDVYVSSSEKDGTTFSFTIRKAATLRSRSTRN